MSFVGILGSGAREHAIAWRLKKDLASPDTQFVFYPGNDYLAKWGTCVKDFSDMIKLAQPHSGHRVIIVGSELYAGVADEWIGKDGWIVWGPTRASAQLEWSKIFSKQWMQTHGVPTAQVIAYTRNAKEIAHGMLGRSESLVMKYDGLLGGKGVCVVKNSREAQDFYDGVAAMAGRDFSGKFVFEEKLEGIERSLFLFVDRSGHVQTGPLCMDFKAKFDGNQGPNTGGMGAFTPAPISEHVDLESLIARISDGLKRSGLVYSGVLYVGLMITPKGPRVLEFNVRLGDPEAQTLLPCLHTSLWDIILKSDQGQLIMPIQTEKGRGWGGIVCATQDYAQHPTGAKDALHPAWLEDGPDRLIFFSSLKSISDGFEVGSGRIATVVYPFNLDSGAEGVLSKERAALAWIREHGWKHIHYRKDLGGKYDCGN